MTATGDHRAEREPLRLGRYDLVYALGQGGMASVFVGIAAGPAGFEKQVAVKVIHPHLLRERRFVKMFLDEARLAAGIVHPNVAAIHEMGEAAGQLFMVGELVEGQSLRAVRQRLFQTNVGLPQGMVAHIGAEICAGLHAAHDLRGPDGRPLELVHRDVSPHNVLIGYNGFVKLIDFGVAQARGRLSHTETGTIKGKLGYLSPEQLEGRPLDRRSDLFSLGVVLYELATGRHPFPGDSGLERLDRIRRARFAAPRDVASGVAPELEQIIVRALARRPEERFPSAAALGEALRAFVARAGDRVGPPVLAAQMRHLFAAEIEEHRQRIRDFKRRGESTARVELEETSRLVRAGSASRSALREWTESGSGLPAGPRWRVPPVVWRIGGGLGAAAVLALAAALLWPTGSPERRAPTAALADPVAREPAPPASPAPTPAVVRLTFDLAPPATRVRVDGTPLAPGTTTLTLPADGEPRLVECDAAGHQPRAVAIVTDRDRSVSCALEPLPTAAREEAPHQPPEKRRRGRKQRRASDLGLAANPF